MADGNTTFQYVETPPHNTSLRNLKHKEGANTFFYFLLRITRAVYDTTSPQETY